MENPAMNPDKWTKSSASSLTDSCVEVVWRKSSRSGPFTDNCVEVGVWQTSTRSSNGSQCVEVSGSPDDGVFLRDTKDRDGGTQHYSRAEWLAFIEGVKAGEFDLA